MKKIIGFLLILAGISIFFLGLILFILSPESQPASKMVKELRGIIELQTIVITRQARYIETLEAIREQCDELIRDRREPESDDKETDLDFRQGFEQSKKLGI